jgi:hypothetical protein
MNVLQKIAVFSLLFCSQISRANTLGESTFPAVTKNIIDESFDGKSIHVASLQANSQLDFTAAVGLVSLAVCGEFKTIELIWWKSKSSKVRELCLSLISYQFNDLGIGFEVIQGLKIEAKRFDDQEEKNRIMEIDSFSKEINNVKIFHKKMRSLRDKLIEGK